VLQLAHSGRAKPRDAARGAMAHAA